ncbi:MAG: DUF4262 domain-containing protein [Methylacidiphilales bacterium]|nr:DUF4262 domain-containing protein [Candidatus Methylacidiphilales bacterium]
MDARYKNSVTSPRIPGFVWQEPQDSRDLSIFRDITTHGCSVLQITPDDTNPDLPYDYCYSIGFYLNLGHAEFLVMGITNIGNMMNDLFSYVETGHSVADQHSIRYDLGRGEVQFKARPVPQERYFDYLGYGCWFYRSLLFKAPAVAAHKFPVLQLCWPDKNGYYPWEPACDPRARQIQTLEPMESETNTEPDAPADSPRGL